MSRRPCCLPGLALTALLLSSTVSPAADNKQQLPEIGTAASATISLAEESRMGEYFMRSIRRSLPLIDDPEINSYINTIGQRLARQSDQHGRQYTFFVVDDPTINAFAGPAGYIGIHSGLILTAEGEGELAAVLAHEIAHVSQRHLARAYEAISNQTLPLTAAILASILIGSQDGQAGAAALAGITAGSAQSQINFTRSNEQEADRIGLDILAQAGFDPRAMPAFFSRLQQSQRLSADLGLDFLRTHPVTLARIADTQGRADQYSRVAANNSQNFKFIQARTRVLAGPAYDGTPVATFFRRQLQEDEQASNRYGLALALYENQQWQTATSTLAPLLDNPDAGVTLHSHLLAARLQSAEGKFEQAQATIHPLLTAYPDNWAVLTTLAKINLQAEQGEAARQLIKHYLARHRQAPPLAYHLLAETENQLGNAVASHRYLAEYYNRNGETRIAIRQLRIALKRLQAAPEQGTKEQLKTRLQALKRRLQEEQKVPR